MQQRNYGALVNFDQHLEYLRKLNIDILFDLLLFFDY